MGKPTEADYARERELHLAWCVAKSNEAFAWSALSSVPYCGKREKWLIEAEKFRDMYERAFREGGRLHDEWYKFCKEKGIVHSPPLKGTDK